MDIGSFFTRDTFAFMQRCVRAEEIFSLKQTFKTRSNTYSLTISATFVDDKLAHDIWQDHNYLIHFGVDYTGKLGIGGNGFATADKSPFRDWDSFKEWIDVKMKHFAEYESDPLGQMSLF